MTRVTLAVPVYKRFDTLPAVLGSVQAQDHEDLDVLVSDNGENGPELEALVERHLERPWRLRRNPSSVDVVTHFNQLLEAAEGEYLTVLCDDDEISSNLVSALAHRLDEDPEVALALPDQVAMDEDGEPLSADRHPHPPRTMTGCEFVRLWCEGRHNFRSYVTNMARTRWMREAGGFPPFPRGNSIDNALIVAMVLGRRVAFEPDAVFRYRVYETSTGLDVPPEVLAEALGGFLRYLDRHPRIQAWARENPLEWDDVRDRLRRMTWGTYRNRWKGMYRDRLGTARWIRSAFTMPFIPEYYAFVLGYFARKGGARVKDVVQRAIGA